MPDVFAMVPGQFVQAGPFPSTAVSVSQVAGLLSCVGFQVCLEVRTLHIGFATAYIITNVSGCPLPGL